MATREDEPVDEGWFRGRLQDALAYRKSLKIDADAYRVLHAEADGVPASSWIATASTS
jgi:23S rRNA (cytosine1962-C5)-methyltransferase